MVHTESHLWEHDRTNIFYVIIQQLLEFSRVYKYSRFILIVKLNFILVCSMESTNLSKAKPFYIPELYFSKTKLKGKKKRKRPTWLLFTETEKVVQNSPWREAE